MVYTRAFSFTDDGINVNFPSMSGLGRIASISGTITGPQSADPAILLFQLRRIQSHWYQTLFQSDPSDTLDDAASFVWQMCHDMREWSESLPDTLPIGIRELFDLELKYSYVYCLAPSAKAPHMTAYGRMLIFEYAIGYLDRIFELAHGPLNSAFYTYHDALRVFFMGSQFMAVLRDTGDALLSGTSVPVPLSLPGRAPPPPMPERSGGDNLERSIRCLEQVTLTLKKYGDRWNDAMSLTDSFQRLSTDLLESLKTKREIRKTAQVNAQAQQAQPRPQYPSYPPGQFAMPPPMQPQIQPQIQPQMQPHLQPPPPQMQMGGVSHPQQTEVKWVDVDISKIMRGGGGI